MEIIYLTLSAISRCCKVNKSYITVQTQRWLAYSSRRPQANKLFQVSNSWSFIFCCKVNNTLRKSDILYRTLFVSVFVCVFFYETFCGIKNGIPLAAIFGDAKVFRLLRQQPGVEFCPPRQRFCTYKNTTCFCRLLAVEVDICTLAPINLPQCPTIAFLGSRVDCVTRQGKRRCGAFCEVCGRQG